MLAFSESIPEKPNGVYRLPAFTIVNHSIFLQYKNAYILLCEHPDQLINT